MRMARTDGDAIPVRDGSPPSALPSVFRLHNRLAFVLWIVVASSLVILLCFTWLFLRDGPPPQVGAFGLPLLGLLWMAGIAASASVCASAVISLRVTSTGVMVREWRPFSVRKTCCASADVRVPPIVDGADEEGDPYFRCLLILPDGHVVAVAESHRRLDVENARERVVAALARRS